VCGVCGGGVCVCVCVCVAGGGLEGDSKVRPLIEFWGAGNTQFFLQYRNTPFTGTKNLECPAETHFRSTFHHNIPHTHGKSPMIALLLFFFRLKITI